MEQDTLSFDANGETAGNSGSGLAGVSFYLDAEKIYDYTLPLKPEFRFMHEPFTFDRGGRAYRQVLKSRFIGRERELSEFIQRILLSEGGAFLITGYRGVGKTSFVNRVILEIKENLAWVQARLGPMEVLDIHLNLARPLTPTELMYHIIRSLYHRLESEGILQKLEPQDQKSLIMAYQRTSMSLSRRVGEGSEKSIGLGDLAVGLQALGVTPKFTASAKRTRTESVDMTFASYDDKAAEYDLIHLSNRLVDGYVEPPGFPRKFIDRLLGAEAQRVRLKIIFVFDELDKLEAFSDAQGEPVINEFVSTLKNLFTTSGMTFIFVAGKDFHERWLEELSRGDSVYESVFAFNKYLPAMWTEVDRFCENLLLEPDDVSPQDDPNYADFIKYLRFKGRGMPRRMLRAFNQHVRWNGDYPFLGFGRNDLRRIRFYANLQAALDGEQKRLLRDIREEVPGESQDKLRLGIYYVLDWILQRGERSFNLKDVLAAARGLSAKIAPNEESAESQIRAIVQTLLNHDYIERLEKRPDQVLLDKSAMEHEERYRLTRRRIIEMGGLVEAFEEDAAVLETGYAGEEERIGRYLITGYIGRGGTSEVYRGWDEDNQRDVAIKVVLSRQKMFLQRIRREGELLRKLSHANIVRFYEYGEAGDRFYLVLDYIDGTSLDSLLQSEKKLDLDTSLSILAPVMDAVGYLHAQGIVRVDLKPGNVMINRSGNVYLIDLGIARLEDPEESRLTSEGDVIGTPIYIAPEQAMGLPVDARADIYSLGVILYQALTGELPFEGDSPSAFIMAHVSAKPTPPRQRNPEVSNALEAVILKCLEKKPEDRYQSMPELREALPDFKNQELASVVKRSLEKEQEVQRWEAYATAIEVRRKREEPASGEPQPEAEIDWTTQPFEPLPPPPIYRSAGTWIGEADGSITWLPEPEDRPYLLVTRGKLAGKWFGLEEDKPLRIGRSIQNDIVLATSKASRFHAEVTYQDGNYILRDLNTSNGTFLNGQRVTEKVLEVGDEIQIGEFVLAYRDPSVDAALSAE